MVDFSHLGKLNVGGAKTATYDLVEVDGNAKLVGVFAGESNKGYHSALIKRSTKNARRVRANRLSGREMQEARDDDRSLFPRFVIKDWSGVVDSSGAVVPYSPEACKDFLDQLPDWLFDDVRNFFANPASFIDDGEDEDEVIADGDVEEVGNS